MTPVGGQKSSCQLLPKEHRGEVDKQELLVKS